VTPIRDGVVGPKVQEVFIDWLDPEKAAQRQREDDHWLHTELRKIR
jgi:hypothetical protein